MLDNKIHNGPSKYEQKPIIDQIAKKFSNLNLEDVFMLREYITYGEDDNITFNDTFNINHNLDEILEIDPDLECLIPIQQALNLQNYDYADEIAENPERLQQAINDLTTVLNDPLMQDLYQLTLNAKYYEQVLNDVWSAEPQITQELENKINSLPFNSYTNNSILRKFHSYNDLSDQTLAIADSHLTTDNKMLSVVFLPDFLSNDTTTTFHELGHVIDDMNVRQKEDKYIYKTGFILNKRDVDGVPYGELKVNGDHDFEDGNLTTYGRQYELFNEVCNDYVTIKVSEHFEATTGKTLGIQRQPSMYSLCFDIMQEFLDKHMAEIIECKMAHDLNKTAGHYFGYDNFNKLARLTEEFATAITDASNSEKQQITEQFKAKVHEIELAIQRHQQAQYSNNQELEEPAFAL